MNFVFFDIECACVSKKAAKICAFGYCVTDEKMNMIEKRDILINPQGGFHLTDRKGEKGIILPYDYDEFKNCPTFPEVYPFIRNLLCGGSIVFGHATMNDVKYLALETHRFSLPPLEFDYYDTQFIYMNRIKTFDRQFGLETISKDLHVDFVPHRAADDAYATMCVAKALCEAENTDFDGLIEKYKIRAGRLDANGITNCTSFYREEYLEQVKKFKQEREAKRNEFCNVVYGKKPKRVSNKLLNRVFNFNRLIEEDVSQSKKYLAQIYSNGGKYSMKTEDCNVYVKTADDNTLRYKNAVANNIDVIEVENLKDYLGSV